MKTIVEVEDFKFGHFERDGAEKAYARIGGRDSRGRWLSAVAFDNKAHALNREMENLTPSGQDISGMRFAVELTGEFRDGKPRQRADGSTTRTRSFFVASYHVLTGPALELTRLRRDAVEVMGRAAEAAASNDHQAAYDALSGFLARVTGRQATHENAAENAAEDAVDHGTDGLDTAAPQNSDTAEAQPAPAERVADVDGGGPEQSEADVAVDVPGDAPVSADAGPTKDTPTDDVAAPADEVTASPPASDLAPESTPDVTGPEAENQVAKADAPAATTDPSSGSEPTRNVPGGAGSKATPMPTAGPTPASPSARRPAPAGTRGFGGRGVAVAGPATRGVRSDVADPEAAAAAHYARKDATAGVPARDVLDDASDDRPARRPARRPAVSTSAPTTAGSGQTADPGASEPARTASAQPTSARPASPRPAAARPAPAAPSVPRPAPAAGSTPRPSFGAFRR